MINERYELAITRIREIKTEKTVKEPFLSYFYHLTDYILTIDELKDRIEDGSYYTNELEELEQWNGRLYGDILPENYGLCYGNPAYACEMLGEEYGDILCVLYAELRAMIPYAFEKKTEYLDILMELFLEIYNLFEGEELPARKEVKDAFYWYASDYCDVFLSDRIVSQVDPGDCFAAKIIMEKDLLDVRYLYYFGEYVSDNEILTAKHLNAMDEEALQKMADVYTEGYRVGFVNTGKDLTKKASVNIRYTLGFEQVIKRAIDNFAGMNLKPTIYRAASSIITKRKNLRIGYYGAIPNKQFDYDHKDDQALIFDKQYMERKLEVMKTTYEQHKIAARSFAGPACVEVFGETPFVPAQNPKALHLSKKQEKLTLLYDNKSSQLTNTYIPGDERSFTIIAYPTPEIGEQYEEIFDEIVKINTLDAKLYEQVQQTIIDALDQGTSVHIKGAGENRTDLHVNLHPLKDPEKETIFENCVADVNIPVGEVFTSPVLEGTKGTLHVSGVYLGELYYKDLSLTFADGMITEYSCRNFETDEANAAYIKENVLYRHETLPMGEFAIGTNTTAYVAARKYGIEDKMPILIAEKTGPHFAVGDTCYSWAEDIKVYNPNGKEIIARDNSVSIKRKEDVNEAYFHCHTDVTIPYEELGWIRVHTADGREISIIEDGRFVLPGTEALNAPLEKAEEI